MQNFKISDIGRILFGLCFILGNLCLFGYFFSENFFFAIAGYWLLIFATIVNLIVFAVLFLYGVLVRKHFEECMKGALILLINIPVAILYYFIGISLLY